jgi:hypothetical protein
VTLRRNAGRRVSRKVFRWAIAAKEGDIAIPPLDFVIEPAMNDNAIFGMILKSIK